MPLQKLLHRVRALVEGSPPDEGGGGRRGSEGGEGESPAKSWQEEGRGGHGSFLPGSNGTSLETARIKEEGRLWPNY